MYIDQDLQCVTILIVYQPWPRDPLHAAGIPLLRVKAFALGSHNMFACAMTHLRNLTITYAEGLIFIPMSNVNDMYVGENGGA